MPQQLGTLATCKLYNSAHDQYIYKGTTGSDSLIYKELKSPTIKIPKLLNYKPCFKIYKLHFKQ